MFAKLGGVLQGWLGVPLRSGLFFWLGGLGLWLLSLLNWDALDKLRQGIKLASGERLVKPDSLALWDFLRSLQETEIALALLGMVALMLLLSGLVKYFEFGALRLLEGYGWPARLRAWVVGFYEKRSINPKLARWKVLAKKTVENPPLTAAEQWEYAALDREVVYLPEVGLRMPTRLGNLLRGYEQRPREKYGLDAIICWPRLWLVLPKETKEELSAARAALDEAVQVWLWGLLFLAWSAWSWLALAVALLMMWGGYRSAVQAADTYGQLLEAAFDVHRGLLYKSLRWPLPANPAAEKPQGAALTAYLWRGSESEQPGFVESK